MSMDKIKNTIINTPKVQDVKPIGIPFRCVVCNSYGTLSSGTKICHGCGGKGYIIIPTEKEGGK